MPKKTKRDCQSLMREAEQNGWDALARGDFSAFGQAADIWTAAYCVHFNTRKKPPLHAHAFKDIIHDAAFYRSAKAPDYNGKL